MLQTIYPLCSVNQFERAYRDYCNFAESQYIEYPTLSRWASRFGINCYIILCPEGFYHQIDYQDGTLSGPPSEIILETVDMIVEAVFSIVDRMLENMGIFDELERIREYAVIPPDGRDLEIDLISDLLSHGLESCEEMIDNIDNHEKFKEKFLDAVVYLTNYINLNERVLGKDTE